MKEANSIYNHSERVVAQKGKIDENDIETDNTKKKNHKKNK